MSYQEEVIAEFEELCALQSVEIRRLRANLRTLIALQQILLLEESKPSPSLADDLADHPEDYRVDRDCEQVHFQGRMADVIEEK